MDFMEVCTFHQAQSQHNSEEAWDYAELREKVRDAIDGLVGERLYAGLRAQWWFQECWVSREDAVDRCLSSYILGSIRSAAGET